MILSFFLFFYFHLIFFFLIYWWGASFITFFFWLHHLLGQYKSLTHNHSIPILYHFPKIPYLFNFGVKYHLCCFSNIYILFHSIVPIRPPKQLKCLLFTTAPHDGKRSSSACIVVHLCFISGDAYCAVAHLFVSHSLFIYPSMFY